MSKKRPALLEGLEGRRLFSAGLDPLGAGSSGIPVGWQSTFADDFDGTTLDSSRWFIRNGQRLSAANTHDSRPDITSPTSVSVGGGDLKLTVYSTPDAHYTGWVQTKRGDTDGVIANDVNDTKFEQSFGYWEARIKFLNGEQGAWHAFWVHSYQMGGNSGPANVDGNEIDVVESAQWMDHLNTDNWVKSTVHWNGYNASNGAAAEARVGTVNSNVADYHVYGMKWSTSSITFYVDGVQLGTPITNPAAISTIRQGIILSQEVTTNWGWAGGIPAQGYGTLATSTTYMKVDYVKVWGDPTAPPPRTPQPVVPPTPPVDPTVPAVKTTIGGLLFNDANKNGVRDAGEMGLPDRKVFIDADGDGLLSINEKQANTDADGYYTLADVPSGTTYQLRQVLPPYWQQTSPAALLPLTVSLVGVTTPVTGANFGSYGMIVPVPAPIAPPTTGAPSRGTGIKSVKGTVITRDLPIGGGGEIGLNAVDRTAVLGVEF